MNESNARVDVAFHHYSMIVVWTALATNVDDWVQLSSVDVLYIYSFIIRIWQTAHS